MKALIEFPAADDARRAANALRSLGYSDLESYGPFPLSSEDAHAPHGSIVLSLLAAGAALVALAAAYLVQWYANADSYPLNIGGRPAHATPAFIPATFETICLFATAALFAGFLLVERLPRLWQPLFEIEGFERSSIDRFWIVLQLRGANAPERLMADVAAMHPLRVVVAEDGP